MGKRREQTFYPRRCNRWQIKFMKRYLTPLTGKHKLKPQYCYTPSLKTNTQTNKKQTTKKQCKHQMQVRVQRNWIILHVAGRNV